ncbi:hypothetical protein HYU21_00600 [Candidatus Woesearchaeota archaeon]|nr:hypothetical protein [Candidatus Woesearchaeota archaeon]
MIKDLFTLREREIFQTLKELVNHQFVVIGGYAVNAYTLPRFSVDCDIVVKDQNELRKVETILLRIGYTKEKLPEEAQYSGNFSRYEKKLDYNFAVSIDILISRVIDRMTGVQFEAEWIFANSELKLLKGKTIAEELKLKIINIKALLVMKIISCRATDIRDVFMMLPVARDKDWVKREINLKCNSQDYNFQERLEKIKEKVSSKQFKDGLSGVYGYFDEKVFEKHKKVILNF